LGIELKGDFVPLVWLIEKLRKREGGCTMNDLIFECKKSFNGLDFIKKSNNIEEVSALHFSAPTGLKCADCTMEEEPCIECYTAYWKSRHPNYILQHSTPSPIEKLVGIDDVVKLQQSVDAVLSPNPLLEEVKKRLEEATEQHRLAFEREDRVVCDIAAGKMLALTELIQFSEGGK